MKLKCAFCKHVMEKNISGPVDVVVCPKCRAKVEIHQENSTVPGETILLIRVLKEGKKKGS